MKISVNQPSLDLFVLNFLISFSTLPSLKDTHTETNKLKLSNFLNTAFTPSFQLYKYCYNDISTLYIDAP